MGGDAEARDAPRPPERGSTAEMAARLARHPPFRELSPSHLERVAAEARVAAFAPGATILRQAGDPATSLFVVSDGIVDLLDEGVVVDHLSEGELFGVSVLSGLGPALTVRARTATECYLIDEERAREILGTSAGLTYLMSAAAHWRERDAFAGRDRTAMVDHVAAIGAAPTVEALVAVAREKASVVGAMLDAGADPIEVGHAIGRSIDELTRRLIELYEAQAGEAPAPFAWLALGSAARHEQALTTDQDHAMAFDVDDAHMDRWSSGMAEWVTGGLEACGISRCDGGVMAVNPAWRRTVSGWRDRFGEYLADPQIMGTRITGIAFDYRRAVGELEVERELDEVIRGAHRDRAFMQRLARTVLEAHPAAGRRGELAVERRGDHRGTVDVKHGALTPITNLARYHAIAVGLSENRTLERLRGAADAGGIAGSLRDDLIEAFRVAWRVRLEHHVMQVEAGRSPDDHVDPATLRPIPRRALGEAVRVVAEAHASLEREHTRR